MSSQVTAVGRRKTASARVILVPGSGKITVNKLKFEEHFERGSHRYIVEEPLRAAEVMGKYDVIANVHGGGKSGQAGAVMLGIARALVKIDEEMKRLLKPHGLMTRDPRMKERRKYGLAKARKRFQFSKR